MNNNNTIYETDNKQNDEGCTVLHNVCPYGRIGIIIELLLDARIDSSIRDNRRITARDYALRIKQYTIAKIIRNMTYTTLLRISNASLCRDIVRMIIEEYT